MIHDLYLENFKCFESLSLELAPLTLLAGFNAAGKSTSLQTLLLLSQTLRAQRGTAELRLNGSLVGLGSPGDVINRAGANRLSLGVATDEAKMIWRFGIDEENRRALGVTELDMQYDSGHSYRFPASELDGVRPPSGGQLPVPVASLLELLTGLVFLSAARQVETEVFPVPQEIHKSAGDVGPIGQYASWWLHQEGDSEVGAARCCNSASGPSTLRQQVNAWAGDLFPDTEINALPVQRTNLMRLELRSGRTSDWSRPSNIGYGISYAFPILVAGLCVQAGQPLIIDSPEAHLHPRGQSRIGSFLAQMASAGTQILVETHSDHVLNGVRVALRDGLIDPAKVAIYFFSRKEGAQVVRLSVDKNGGISDWPEGFFDQSEKDLASLAGWV